MRNLIDRSIRLSVLAAAVSFGVAAEPAAAQNTQRGAVIGGLGGAIAGALIGDHNDKAGAGAAIGGVIGAVGGAVVGNAKDKEVTYQRQQRAQAYQQRVYAQQQMQAAQVQSAVSIGDVITMSKSGLSDSVMITQIQTRGIQQQLSVNDIIALHQQGLSETVITAMQNARIGSAPSVTTVTTYPAPVVVQEQYVVPSYSPPPVYHQQRRVYHRGHYHYR